MKYFDLLPGKAPASRVALGCMRIAELSDAQAQQYLCHAVEMGYNYFDHADIYGGGECERVFGRALKANPRLRDKLLIQSKVGIRKGMYDFSADYLLSAVEATMTRLGVDHLDALLLHRPDLLMEPEEVAEVFDKLHTSGKVGAFGVSNHSAQQLQLLQAFCDQKLIINQLQLSLAHATLISSGANVNLDGHDGVNYDGYLRDYCRLNGITVQAWSPLQHGFISGTFMGNEDYPQLNAALRELAEKYGVTDTGMAIAWLLRLPEKVQPVVGSVNPERLTAIAEAAEIELSREDWYRLYLAAGYRLP